MLTKSDHKGSLFSQANRNAIFSRMCSYQSIMCFHKRETLARRQGSNSYQKLVIVADSRSPGEQAPIVQEVLEICHDAAGCEKRCFHRYETSGEPSPSWDSSSCQLSPHWHEASGSETQRFGVSQDAAKSLRPGWLVQPVRKVFSC